MSSATRNGLQYAREVLEQEIAEAAAQEILTGTNSGTYGAAEAVRCCGSGDPRHADYRIYTSVGGGTRHEGCDPSSAPGYLRELNQKQLQTAQAALARLRKDLRSMH